MPDYAEKALEAGWVQVGTKWKHDDYPGCIYYNAKQIWDEKLPAKYRRPLSVTPPEPKTVEAKPVLDPDGNPPFDGVPAPLSSAEMARPRGRPRKG